MAKKKYHINNKLTGIYKITNTVNEKVYIGSSVNINIRWRQHLSTLKNNKHHSVKLQNSVNKYGLDNFKFDVIEECAKDMLLQREQYYLELFNSFNDGYNCSMNSTNPMLGRKHSEVTKKLMSKLNSGKNHPSYGKKHTEEYKRYMKLINTGENNPNYGRKENPEIIKKRVEKVKNEKIFAGENNPNFKFKIEANDLIDLFLNKNKTQKEISEIYKCSIETIKNNLKKNKIYKK